MHTGLHTPFTSAANYGDEPLAADTADYAAWATLDDAATEVNEAAVTAERAAQAHILRDVFGRFPDARLASIDGYFLTPTILSLAARAYDDRLLPSGHLDPAHLATLADALAAAGCNDAELLGHLRSPYNHVRGCHGLDRVMSRN